jgi:dihydrofolate reductase
MNTVTDDSRRARRSPSGGRAVPVDADEQEETRMGQVVVEVSPSIDGYVAGPGVSVERPLGADGQRLHRWIGFEDTTPTDADRAAAEWMFTNSGAVVIGRRMFDVGIGLWGEDGAFGMPVYVVTNRAHDDLVRGPTTFRFVTTGVVAAVEQACAAAGDRDVVIAGGAQVIQQGLAAGLVDEIRLHVVPVLLGDGTRLFEQPLAQQMELEPGEVQVTRHATHMRFRVAAR